MKISLIAAMGKNRVIGKDNKLLWKLPKDMKRFRTLTSKKPIIMGRKTYESIGRPLPNRTNIIITRDKNYKVQGCVVVHTIDESLDSAKDSDEVMIIGGCQIYKEFLPKANKMYLTYVDGEFEADAYFPEFNEDEWKVILKENHKKDEYHNFDFTFVNLER
jgi:dihydrofolate reductase